MKEKYDPTSLGVIIEHLCFENEHFSLSLGHLLLRGINKATFDESPSYLEAITHYLNIPDSLMNKRMEWILGQPQPIFISLQNENGSFGMYGNLSLDDLTISYESPLNPDGCTSLLNLMVQSKRKYEALVMNCLKYLLINVNLNQIIFNYIITLPPPSYNFAKYSDWFLSFIENFISDAKRYYNSYSKEQLGLEVLKLYKIFEARLSPRLIHSEQIVNEPLSQPKEEEKEANNEKFEDNKSISQNTIPNSSLADKNSNIIPHVIKPYIIGKTIYEEKLEEREVAIDEHNEVTFLSTEITSYITDSKPTGKNNISFPPSTIKDNTLVWFNIKSTSVLANFIQPRSTGSSSAASTRTQESQSPVKFDDISPISLNGI